MIFTKQEKLQPLNYQETDSNYLELRNIVDFIFSQTNQTNILDQDVDDIVNGVNNLENNFLKKSNNLDDLNSFTVSRNVLEIYSKLEENNKFLDVVSNLSNIQDINTVRENIEIGTNALRNLNIEELIDYPTSIEGEDGDLWIDYGSLEKYKEQQENVETVDVEYTGTSFDSLNFLTGEEYEYLESKTFNILINGDVNYQEPSQPKSEIVPEEIGSVDSLSETGAIVDTNTNQIEYKWLGTVIFTESGSVPTKNSPSNSINGGDGYFYYCRSSVQETNSNLKYYVLKRYKQEHSIAVISNNDLTYRSIIDLNQKYFVDNNESLDFILYAQRQVIALGNRDSFSSGDSFYYGSIDFTNNEIFSSSIVSLEDIEATKEKNFFLYSDESNFAGQFSIRNKEHNEITASSGSLFDTNNPSNEKNKTICVNKNNDLFIFTDQGRMFKYNSSGQEIYKTTINSLLVADREYKPSVADGYIYATPSSGNFYYKINQSNGSFTQVNTNFITAPFKIITGGSGYMFFAKGTKIYKVNRSNNNLEWEFDFGAPIVDFDVHYGNKVFAIIKITQVVQGAYQDTVFIGKIDKDGVLIGSSSLEGGFGYSLSNPPNYAVACYPGKYGSGFWE